MKSPGKKTFWVRIAVIFSVIGPGIISGTADNDAGGITTYSVVGAHFGYQMLWMLLVVGLILWLTQDMGARLGLVTGKGLSALIRENFNLRITVIVILVTSIANWANVVAEFAGIASVANLYHIPPYVLVPVCAALISFIVIGGSFKIVQRVFLTSSVLYLGYIAAGFMAQPDWGAALAATFIPTVSFTPSFLFTSVALVGTTVTAWGQFFVQSYYVDKGVHADELKLVRWDIAAGTLWTVVVAYFIVIATAATLWTRGIPITDAADAALALEPFAGFLAKHLFAWGLLNASLLGAGVVTIATSYMITESFGWEGKMDHGMKESPTFYKLFLAAIVSASLFVLLPRMPLVTILLLSQAMNTFALPILFICMLLLLNHKRLMGRYVNTPFHNVIAAGAIGLVIILNIVYFISFFV